MSEQIRESEQGLLQNQVAIVTSAAKGIGQGIAIEMAREGAVVVLADIDEAGSHATMNTIYQSGGNALTVLTDISNEQHCQQLVDKTLAHFGRIDILVNNVGIGVHSQGGILAMNREDAVKIVKTNLVEPLFLTQRVAREMVVRKTHGSILFTSSIHAKVTYLDPLYTSSLTKRQPPVAQISSLSRPMLLILRRVKRWLVVWPLSALSIWMHL